MACAESEAAVAAGKTLCDPRRRRVLMAAGTVPLASLGRLSAATVSAEAPSAGAAPRAPTLLLSRFATSLDASTLTPTLRQLFGVYLLDCMATMLAGCMQPVHRLVRMALAGVAGRGEVTAVGGGPVSLSMAVMLDALAAADFEFEHVMAGSHPSSTAFPALLGLAAERDLAGTEMLAAMVAAYEIAARIGTASGPEVEDERGFHNPGLNGTLAAAAGCARLLRFDADTCASAMGIAASSSAGLMAYVEVGAMTKRLHPARCAQLGMESALLASAGVDGPRNVLESRRGYLHAFAPTARPQFLVQGLGSDWQGVRMIAKFAPAHARAQPWLEAIAAARDRGETWQGVDIVSVVMEVPAAMLAEPQMNPQAATLVAAQYSVVYCVAVALARDLRNPMRMSDSVTSDPDVRRIAAAIRVDRKEGPSQAPTLTVNLVSGSLDLPIPGYAGAPGSPGFAAGVDRKLGRTLAALRIDDHGVALRNAVGSIESAHGPRRLREALVAAAGDASRRNPAER